MTMSRCRNVRPQLAAIPLALLGYATLADAQSGFPNRPVRIIVPGAPGTGFDSIARLMAPSLADRLGRQLVVENRAGAGTLIGNEYVSKAAPDGHTLLMAASALTIQPALMRKMPYDVERDFAPVSLIASAANVVVVNGGLPVKNVADLVALAKTRPLLYASAGTGTPAHLAGEMMNLAAGLKMGHVPYKGAGPALADVLAGQVHLIITSPIAAMPHVSGGRVRIIATTGRVRDPMLPDLPPVADTLPGYEITQWWGMMAPAKTPRPVVQRLNRELGAILGQSDVRERLVQQGAVLHGGTPEQFAQFIAAERKRLGAIIRQAGITLRD